MNEFLANYDAANTEHVMSEEKSGQQPQGDLPDDGKEGENQPPAPK
jgi:hypothetical protein